MNTRQKLTLGIAAIFMVTLTIVGVTYAYFQTRITGDNGTETVDISTAEMANIQFIGDGQKVVDMTDVMPGEARYKYFTVKNNSTEAGGVYDIFLETVPVQLEGETENVYGVEFVHTADSNLTTCYADDAYDKLHPELATGENLTSEQQEANAALTAAQTAIKGTCYDDEQAYNSIVYTLWKVDTLPTGEVTSDPAGTLVGTAAQKVAFNATNANPQLLATNIPIEVSVRDDKGTPENTEDDVITYTEHYYVVKIQYVNDTAKNQNIENRAELDIKVDIR